MDLKRVFAHLPRSIAICAILVALIASSVGNDACGRLVHEDDPPTSTGKPRASKPKNDDSRQSAPAAKPLEEIRVAEKSLATERVELLATAKLPAEEASRIAQNIGPLMAENKQASNQLAIARKQAKACEQALRNLGNDIARDQRLLSIGQPAAAVAVINARLAKNQASYAQVQSNGEQAIGYANQAIEALRVLSPKIQALEKSFGDELVRLQPIRTTWLDKHVLPAFNRCEFGEAAERADELLRVDQLWADGYLWSAFSKCEADQLTDAELTIGEAMQKWQLIVADDWPQGSALHGYILSLNSAGSPERNTGYKLISEAPAKSKGDRFVSLVCGRSYMKRILGPDKSFEQAERAKQFLSKAMGEDGIGLSAQFWLAELQAFSSSRRVNNIDGHQGSIDLYEDLWKRTGSRSREIAVRLAKLHDSHGSKTAARAFEKAAVALNPVERIDAKR